MDEKLLLKWSSHKTSFTNSISSFWYKGSYTDVTLVCDGKYYEAHKLVLSSCSKYFQEIFENVQSSHPNPIVILNGIRADDLERILNYMYLGKVEVEHEFLDSLIIAAECLKLKGIALPSDEDDIELKSEPVVLKSPQIEINMTPTVNLQRSLGDKTNEIAHNKAEDKNISPKKKVCKTRSDLSEQDAETGKLKKKSRKSLRLIKKDTLKTTKKSSDFSGQDAESETVPIIEEKSARVLRRRAIQNNVQKNLRNAEKRSYIAEEIPSAEGLLKKIKVRKVDISSEGNLKEKVPKNQKEKLTENQNEKLLEIQKQKLPENQKKKSMNEKKKLTENQKTISVSHNNRLPSKSESIADLTTSVADITTSVADITTSVADITTFTNSFSANFEDFIKTEPEYEAEDVFESKDFKIAKYETFGKITQDHFNSFQSQLSTSIYENTPEDNNDFFTSDYDDTTATEDNCDLNYEDMTATEDNCDLNYEDMTATEDNCDLIAHEELVETSDNVDDEYHPTVSEENEQLTPNEDYQIKRRSNNKSKSKRTSWEAKFISGNIPCPFCRYCTESMQKLILHMPAHPNYAQKPYSCPYCDYTSDFENVRQHAKEHCDSAVNCRQCSHQAATLSELKSHIAKQHGDVSEDITPRRRVKKSTITANNRKKNANGRSKIPSTKQNKKKHQSLGHIQKVLKKCKLCPYNTYKTGLYKRHILIHSGEKPFPCPYCDYRCNRRTNLYKHIVNIHNPNSNYPCTQCSFKSSSKSLLNIHKRLHKDPNLSRSRPKPGIGKIVHISKKINTKQQKVSGARRIKGEEIGKILEEPPVVKLTIENSDEETENRQEVVDQLIKEIDNHQVVTEPQRKEIDNLELAPCQSQF